MQIETRYKKGRLIFFFLCLILFTVYLIYSYAKIAFSPSTERAFFSQEYIRGSIYDRNGKPLAVQASLYHLAATPSAIKDIAKTAKVLAPYLEKTEEEIIKQINEATIDFVYIEKKLSQEKYEALLSLISSNKLYGLRFDKVQGRIYPEKSLASQVIGFMGNDGKGLSGIEYTMQKILSPDTTKNPTNPIHYGNDIYLTIDANLQYKLEQVALENLEEHQAESIMIIASDAKKGEILSYVSLPSTDLNEYPSAVDAEKIDRPAAISFEPGSVFKIFSIASFLETGAIGENELFYCDGKYEIPSAGGEKAVINCLGHHGWISAREALEYSCNDALAQMSEKIDARHFVQMLRAFGFGSKTLLEVPLEISGSIKSPSDRLWSNRSKPTMSIGQELSVSAIQMIQATTALANKGYPLQLTYISQIAESDGKLIYQHTPEYKEPVISEATSRTLLDYMKTTAEVGTGSRAQLGDVTIGVKTGTAQMIDPITKGYSKDDYISNCVAIFPIEDPEIILYIVITKAKGETYAGRIVAPIIAEAADIIIDHLGLARKNASSLIHSGKIELPKKINPEIGTSIPNFIGLSKRELVPLLERDDIHFIIRGDGWVSSQNPPPGTPLQENMTIELYLQ